MKVDPQARYTKTHEWVRPEGEVFVYGITDHAQESMSDIVFVELPEVGTSFEAGASIGALESVKAASDLFVPLAGEVVEINERLIETPEMANSDPYGEGWMIKFKAADPAEFENLLSPEAYAELEEV